MDESADELRDWLDANGLGRHVEAFERHEITLDILPLLTDADVDRLELPTGPRRRLLIAIEALHRPHAPRASKAAAVPEAAVMQPVERRQLTVMFCDLVGSTALAEHLDLEDLRELMHAYRSACSNVVARYNGYVAQYLGDGLMVYFGWPNAHEDDPERAVRTALGILDAVRMLGRNPEIAVRIGVATGKVVVGADSPAAAPHSMLALGETPNMAARLLSLAGPGEIVISSATRVLVGDAFDLHDLGTHLLRGVSQPVHAWRVRGLGKVHGRFETTRRSALTPLVGREDESALLLRRWQQACNGEGQVVLLGGDAGIGKSRLVRVLRGQIPRDSYTAMSYQCSPYHANSALHPVLEHMALSAHFERDDTPEQKLDKLENFLVGDSAQRAQAVPLFAALLSLPLSRYPPLTLLPQRQKEKTLEAMIEQVESLSRRGKVLMIFEDVHWVDPTTQEALDMLVSRIRRLPVLLLITHRPEYESRWTELPHVTALTLQRLAQPEVAELMRKIAQERVLPEQVLDRIVAHTDSVPLFVEELTKTVLESGLLQAAGDQYTLRAPLSGLVIPSSLRESLLARLDRLAPVKQLLQIGACIGRQFSRDLLAKVAGLPDAQLDDSLARLIDAGLIHRRGSAARVTYVFKHALVQDAAYDSLLKRRRQELHALLAHILTSEFPEQVESAPEVAAHHYTEAGDAAAAAPLWREAGKLAARKVAWQEAAGHFQRALALVGSLPPSSERDVLELSIREPLNAAWTTFSGWAADEVTANAEAILDLARRQGKSTTLLIGLWGIWVNTITQGRVADSLKWAQRLLAEGDTQGSLDLQIFGHGAAMISHFHLGNLLEARGHGERVLELYDPQHASRWAQVSAHDLRTLVGVWSCQWAWMLGYPDQAVRLGEERDAHARAIGHAFNLGFALTLGAHVFDYRGEPRALFVRIEEAQRLERAHSVPFIAQVMLPQLEGLAHLRNGNLLQAMASLRQGLDNWSALGGRSRVPYLKSQLAEALALHGDIETALLTIDECLEQIERPGWQERSHLAEILRLKGWMLMSLGHDDEAERLLREAIDRARRQQARAWELRAATTLARLLVSRGEAAAACALLAPIHAWFTEGFDTHDLKAAHELLESLERARAA